MKDKEQWKRKRGTASVIGWIIHLFVNCRKAVETRKKENNRGSWCSCKFLYEAIPTRDDKIHVWDEKGRVGRKRRRAFFGLKKRISRLQPG